MKNVLIASVLCLMPLSAMAALPSIADTVAYQCDGFKNGQGEPLLGTQVAIVSRINDLTGAKEYLVRTGAIVPKPVFKYEVMTLINRQIETAQYETENYKVDTFFMGGARAHIQQKGSLIFSNCVSAKKLN